MNINERGSNGRIKRIWFGHPVLDVGYAEHIQ